MRSLYRHRQIGWTIIIVLGLAALFAAAAGLATPWPTSLFSSSPPILTGLLFSSLTIEVTASELVWSFGPGFLKKRVALSGIASAAPARNKWWWGWGVHLTPRGWLYNVDGLDAVEITQKDGASFRLGTDEPQALAQSLGIYDAGRPRARTMNGAAPAFLRSASAAPREAGAYALLISLPSPLSVKAGARTASLTPGLYLYCGSARGPGGLAARIARHMRREKRAHWHVDQLTREGDVLGAFVFPGGDECAINAALEDFRRRSKVSAAPTAAAVAAICVIGRRDCDCRERSRRRSGLTAARRIACRLAAERRRNAAYPSASTRKAAANSARVYSFLGWAKISAAGPASTTLPCRITMSSAASAFTTFRSWLMKT